MQLSESEESENTNSARIKFVDTSNPDHKGDLWLSRDVDLSSELSLPFGIDFISVGFSEGIFLLLDSTEKLLPLGVVGSPALFSLLFKGCGNFCISFFFLAKTFRFGNVRHHHKLKNYIKYFYGLLKQTNNLSIDFCIYFAQYLKNFLQNISLSLSRKMQFKNYFQTNKYHRFC